LSSYKIKTYFGKRTLILPHDEDTLQAVGHTRLL